MPDLNRSLLSEGENADTLGGLTDVTITAPAQFESLVYDGTNWVNQNAPVVSLAQNAEANTLTVGTVVYLFGGTGSHASVKRADNTSDATSSKTVGMVAASIGASATGPIVTRGYVSGMDLSTGYTAGDVLWLGTNGQFTKTKTVAPNHLVFVGVVVRATVNGIIYVATQNGYELDEIHNVAISNTVANGDFLRYNGTVWVNDVIDLGTDTNGNYVGSVAAGTGITVSNTGVEGGTFTVTNAGVTSIAGTANQITASASTGSVTLSLPANVTISNNLTVTGNLTVSGTTTTVNTATLSIADNIITLNSDYTTGAPSENAGIEVLRGSSATVSIRWNETTDKWEFTVDGTNYTELGAGGASVSSSAPASPTTGSLWFDSDTAQTFVYYDSSWVEIGASSNGVTISDTAPSSPIVGQIWYKSDTGATYIYYDSYWVEVGGVSTNIVLNTIDAKGDLIVGTADNTISKLSAGTNGYVLAANSATATGLEWTQVSSNPMTSNAAAIFIMDIGA